MATLPLRQNPRPLPPGLKPRHLPEVDFEKLRVRSPNFRLMVDQMAEVVPGPKTPRIVSSAHGRIRKLLLTYPGYAAGDYSYRDVYADLFKKLPPHTELVILHHRSAEPELTQALAQAGVAARTTTVVAPEHVHFLVWAEDPYVVVHDAAQAGRVFLLEPYTFPRASDAVISDYVNEAANVRNFQSPLYFQGGNILIGDDFFFIGVDYPANTLRLIERGGHIIVPDGERPEDFVRQLYVDTFDPRRKIAYVGTNLTVPARQVRRVTIDGQPWSEEIYAGTGTAQPIFHIDMFVSLAGRNAATGKYRVLVGSPAMAAELLGASPPDHAMAPVFDDVARNLERQGFEVIRNPLPLTYVDDASARWRMWYFATANNCLVEITKTTKTVWLPTYGHGDWRDLAVVDRKNKEIWQGLGFDVVELGDFNPFTQGLGSVHCIKKYLARDEDATDRGTRRSRGAKSRPKSSRRPRSRRREGVANRGARAD